MAGKAADAGAATSEAGKAAATSNVSPDAGKTTETAGAKAGEAAAGKTTDDGKTGGDGNNTGGDGKTGDEGKGKEAQSGKKDGDSKTGDDGAAAQKKAPDTYEFTVPDDAKRFVSDDDLERFQAIAKANDWTQEEAAQALAEELEFAKGKQTKAVEAWEAATKTDKTYGGKNLADTQRLGNAAVDAVLPKGHPMRDPFVAFLKESGGGVRLEVVAFLAELGRKLGEDTPSSGKTAAQGKDASSFYNHPTSRKAADEAARGA